jgi:hypothetical protein
MSKIVTRRRTVSAIEDGLQSLNISSTKRKRSDDEEDTSSSSSSSDSSESETSQSSDEEICPTTSKKKNKEEPEAKLKWTKCGNKELQLPNFSCPHGVSASFRRHIAGNPTPLRFFEYFLDDKILDTMVQRTNEYAHAKNSFRPHVHQNVVTYLKNKIL